MASVLFLFVPHLSFLWCLGRAVLRDCGIVWISVLFYMEKHLHLYSFSQLMFMLSPSLLHCRLYLPFVCCP